MCLVQKVPNVYNKRGACRKNRAFWLPPIVGNTCLEMEFKPVIYNHKKIKHKINTR